MTRLCMFSHKGPRENLEDAAHGIVVCDDLVGAEYPLLDVCDGVGGNCCGEIASAIARDVIVALMAAFLATARLPMDSESIAPDTVFDAMTRAFASANSAITKHASLNQATRGMATTAVCACVVENVLYVAWSGDSRCYHHSRGTLRRMTTDHTQLQQLLDLGLISAADAAGHPLAHTIDRFLGANDRFQPDTHMARIKSGDVILLSTDGLTDVVSDQQIAGAIMACQEGDFGQLARKLGEEALAAGTQDNVTILACEYQPSTGRELLQQTCTESYLVRFAESMQALTQEVTV